MMINIFRKILKESNLENFRSVFFKLKPQTKNEKNIRMILKTLRLSV